MGSLSLTVFINNYTEKIIFLKTNCKSLPLMHLNPPFIINFTCININFTYFKLYFNHGGLPKIINKHKYTVIWQWTIDLTNHSPLKKKLKYTKILYKIKNIRGKIMRILRFPTQSSFKPFCNNSRLTKDRTSLGAS